MRESIDLIDITPRDNDFSPEKAEEYRAEQQPRGHEGLEADRRADEKMTMEMLNELRARGEELEAVEDQAEKKTGPAALAEKFKKNKAFRTRVTVMASSILLAGGIIAAGIAFTPKNANTPAPAPAPAAQEKVIDMNEDIDTNIEETEVAPDNFEEAEGINDGSYYEEGMWCSETKPNSVAFSDFKTILDKFEGGPKSAAEYLCREVEAKSDYIAGLNDALRPEAFKGLSELEINEKLESLSPEEFDKVSKEFNETLKKVDDVKKVELNGTYINAYMAVKDGDQLLGTKEAMEKGVEINHENMQLIACQTAEKNTPAYELSWHDDDGNLIGSIIIKESCGQVVEKVGQNPTRFVNLPEATEDTIVGGGPIIITTTVPTDPTPTPTPTPTPKKWGKSGNPHAGTDYGQTIVTNPAVPDISGINIGNQGYIDDGQATPGAASGVYTGGGEDQSDGSIAGENPYHSDESAGQSTDNSGNQAQEQAQEHNDTGGDNNSDKQEESRVAEGDF